MTELSLIKENIEKIRAEMKAYPDSRLMAVVKTRGGDEIEYAISSCGIDLVGENRVQEFISHEPFYCGADVHFIGTLQKNKVKYLVGKAAMIESVDSLVLAEEISRRSKAAGITTEVLIEVNTGCEEQKSGVMPDGLASLVYGAAGLDGIKLRGLMTVAPICESASEKRGYFALLRRLRDENVSYLHSPLLSMGMSGSYREALEEGADIIRVGTRIFGKRI